MTKQKFVFKALDHLNDLLILLKGKKTLRHWTINDLLFFLKVVTKLWVDFKLSKVHV